MFRLERKHRCPMHRETPMIPEHLVGKEFLESCCETFFTAAGMVSKNIRPPQFLGLHYLNTTHKRCRLGPRYIAQRHAYTAGVGDDLQNQVVELYYSQIVNKTSE